MAGPNIEIVFHPLLSERDPSIEGEKMTVDQTGAMINRERFVEIARIFEKNNMFFMLYGSHASIPKMTLDTIEAVFKAAPETCVGVGIAEENLHRFEGMLKTFLIPLMELSLKYQKKIYAREPRSFWFWFAQNESVTKGLFQSRYKDVLIPISKNNNLASVELNVGTLVGLWKAGIINSWGTSALHDSLRWANIYELSGESQPDQILRAELAMASMGCTVYFIEQGNTEFLLEPGNINPYFLYAGKSDPRYSLGYYPLGNARRLFWQLWDKGIITSIRPDQLLISPLSFIIDYIKDTSSAFNVIRRYLGEKRAPFDTTNFTMETTHSNYIGRLLYGAQTYFDTLYPKTPYGYFALYPFNAKHVLLSDKKKEYLLVRENYIYKLGEERKGNELDIKAILDIAEKASLALPFHCKNAFMSIQLLSPNHYRLILIDPNYLIPKGKKISIHANFSLSKYKIIDSLNKETIIPKERTIYITIPAGGFRIIEVMKNV